MNAVDKKDSGASGAVEPAGRPVRAGFWFLCGMLMGVLLVVAAIAGKRAYINYSKPLLLRDLAKNEVKGGGDNIFVKAAEDGGIPYELNPNVSKFHESVLFEINSDGFRDREFPLEKPEGITRIAVVGDSFAFGHGLPIEHTISRQLEGILNEEGSTNRFEVMNFGVSGFTTVDELAFFKSKALKYQPDVLLIVYFLNDPDRQTLDLSIGENGVEICNVLKDYFKGRVRNEKKLSEIRDVFGSDEKEAYLKELTEKNPYLDPYYHYLHHLPFYWDPVHKAMAEFAQLSKKHMFKTIVVILPDLNVDLASYPYKEIHDFVAQEAHDNGFPCIDMLPHMRNISLEELRLSRSDAHTSAAANRLIAFSIASMLNDRKYDLSMPEFKAWCEKVSMEMRPTNQFKQMTEKELVDQVRETNPELAEKISIAYVMDCLHVDDILQIALRGQKASVIKHTFMPPSGMTDRFFGSIKQGGKYLPVKLTGRGEVR